MTHRPFAVALLVILLWPSCRAVAGHESERLLTLDLEQLLSVEVTTASGRETRWRDSAASVYVIQRSDIEHSSATTLPDLLRTVPGVNVAQISSHNYAVSIRGHNDLISTKLLVLIDGRTIYEWYFSGTFWFRHDIPLELIERIEVVRGSGGVLWGANAVNGVINIITRKAIGQDGWLVHGAGGNVERQRLSASYTGRTREGTDYRLYLASREREGLEETPTINGMQAEDGWRNRLVGMRFDNDLVWGGKLAISSQLTQGEIDQWQWYPQQPLPGSDYSDFYLQGRWVRRVSSGAELDISGYLDRFENYFPLPYLGTSQALEVKLSWLNVPGHSVQLGLGGRNMRMRGELNEAFLNGNRVSHYLLQGFIRDEIELGTPDLTLTLGTKLEYYDEIDRSFLAPSARLKWRLGEEALSWAAWSRVEHVASPLNRGLQMRLADVVVGDASSSTPQLSSVYIWNNPQLESVSVESVQWGVRLTPSRRHYIDLSLFTSRYRGLWRRIEELSQEALLLDGNVAATLFRPLPIIDERNFGGELTLGWRSVPWLVEVGYAAAREGWFRTEENTTPAIKVAPIKTASDTVTLRGGWEQGRYSANLWIRYVGELSEVFANAVQPLEGGSIPAYTAVDLSLSWRPSKATRLQLSGRNLGADHHQEFDSFGGDTMIGYLPQSWLLSLSHQF